MEGLCQKVKENDKRICRKGTIHKEEAGTRLVVQLKGRGREAKGVEEAYR